MIAMKMKNIDEKSSDIGLLQFRPWTLTPIFNRRFSHFARYLPSYRVLSRRMPPY